MFMGVLHVCLLYGGHTSLIQVKDTWKFDELVDLFILELRFNYVDVVVTMTYSLDSTLPPVRILSNKNVVMYLQLKSIDGTISSYPIRVDVLTVDPLQTRWSLQFPESSNSVVSSSSTIFLCNK